MDPIIEEKPNGDIHVIYFLYNPSKAAGWAFLVLFGVATLAHFILMFPFRSAFFIPLIIGGLSESALAPCQRPCMLTSPPVETFGYYGRAWANDEPDNISPWILQAMLIISAPPMIAASVYMALSRTIRALHARENALMSPRGMTPLFVTADIIAFLSQLAGVGLQAARGGDGNVQSIGKKCVLAGLIFQLVLLAFFIVNIYVFHMRNNRNPTVLTDHPQLPRWRRLMYILYFIGTAIFVRNLVRTVEYVQGPRGQVARVEWFVYVFDAALMFLAMVALFISHPGRLIKKAKRLDGAVEGAAEANAKEGLGIPLVSSAA